MLPVAYSPSAVPLITGPELPDRIRSQVDILAGLYSGGIGLLIQGIILKGRACCLGGRSFVRLVGVRDCASAERVRLA